MRTPPRNGACHCGSGRKYKRCCGAAAGIRAARDPRAARADAIAAVRDDLHATIMVFARSIGGDNWLRASLDAYLSDFDEELYEDEVQLALPWALFHYPDRSTGRSMAEHLRDTPAQRLRPAARALLQDEIAACFSFWRITGLDTGVGFTAVDLFRTTEQFIVDPPRAEYLRVGDTILARVVVHDDIATISGMHAEPLPADVADELTAAMRQSFRTRVRPVAPAKLRDPKRQLDMLDLWRSVFEPESLLPELTNPEGDPLIFITDRFDFRASARSAVLSHLAQFPGANPATEIDTGTEVIVTRGRTDIGQPGYDSIVARIDVRDRYLLAETNSERRANDLKEALRTSLGTLVRHRTRSAESVEESTLNAIAQRGELPATDASTPEMDDALRQFRERYMQTWLTESIPALGGSTPMEAAADPAQHAALHDLLDHVETSERHLPRAQQIDFTALRRQLGPTFLRRLKRSTAPGLLH